MNQENRPPPSHGKPTGCFLLGLYPLIVAGSILMSASPGHDVGWLWIPFSILVMWGFGIIHYRWSGEVSRHDLSYSSFFRSFFGYVAKQILVLLVLVLILWLFSYFCPFCGGGKYR